MQGGVGGGGVGGGCGRLLRKSRAAEDADMLQPAIAAIEVEPVANDEFIRNA